MSTATAEISIDAVVARQFDAINRHDTRAFASGYRPNAPVSDPWYPEPLKGADALARDFDDFFTAFPDLNFQIRKVVANGDEYAVQFTYAGTHKGPLVAPGGHIPATDRRIEIWGAAFGRIDAEGRITEERRHYDVAALMNQLGLVR